MKTIEPAKGTASSSSQLSLDWGRSLGWLALLLFCGISLVAQSPAVAASRPANGIGSGSIALQVHGTMILEGPWRFQTGDDPQWADPGFDDSKWSTVTLGKSLADQGMDPYTGYAWYRLRVQPQQLAQFKNLPGNPPLDLLLTSDSVGQLGVYVNGFEAGHMRGMKDEPNMYRSPPLAVRISGLAADGSVVVAVRSWAGPDVSSGGGLLDKVELGTHEDVADKLAMATERLWDEHVISGVILGFLFLCVALLGATLYLAQRHHSEYLWLALLCLSFTVTVAVEAAFALALMPLSVFGVVHMWLGRAFMAITLEFVVRFSGNQFRKVVRIVQIFLLVLPIVFLLHLQHLHDYLSVAAEVVFCGLISVMLFRAWRRGLTEAGVMLLPFFLAATADSIDTVLDYSASQHWIA
ncbi:MAG: 7TM diverse intracellular signaling domain-containing protein, partial [Terracidiphilus sp.]